MLKTLVMMEIHIALWESCMPSSHPLKAIITNTGGTPQMQMVK